MTKEQPKPSPWYQDGLQFTCSGCGDCCTGTPGWVWVNQQEIKAIAAEKGIEDTDEFEALYVRKIGARKSLKEFPNGGLRFFRLRIATVSGLSFSAPPVSHLAFLGFQPQVTRNLAADLSGMPRKWHRKITRPGAN